MKQMEIETIREKNITVKLSGTDCDNLDDLVKQIKRECKKPMTVYIGKDVAKLHIGKKNTFDNGFLIIISYHASKFSVQKYRDILQESIKTYYNDEIFFKSKKLTAEEMLKYCIIVNKIPIAGFYNLTECQHIDI